MYTKENIPIDKVRLLEETPLGYKILKNKGGKIKKYENGGKEPSKVGPLLDLLSSGSSNEDIAGYAHSIDPNFGQDAIDDAKNYHLMRLDSPIYRNQLEESILTNPHLSWDIKRGFVPGSKDLPKNDVFLSLLNAEELGGVNTLSRKQLREIFKNVPAKDRPKTMAGKQEMAQEIIEKGKNDVIDRLIGYRRSLIERNPVNVKTLMRVVSGHQICRGDQRVWRMCTGRLAPLRGTSEGYL
jgi:hypothetical protein